MCLIFPIHHLKAPITLRHLKVFYMDVFVFLSALAHVAAGGHPRRFPSSMNCKAVIFKNQE
jgi:hypothetical protein